MKYVRSGAIALLSLLITAPTSLAGGEVDAHYVVLEVEDNQGRSCATNMTGWCVATVENASDLQDASIDAYNEHDYAAVIVKTHDLSAGHVEDPDPIVLRTRDVNVSNPIIPMLAPSLSDHTIEALGGEHYFRMDEQAFAIGWFGPWTPDPENLRQREISNSWKIQHGVLGYDYVATPNPQVRDSSDAIAYAFLELTCAVAYAAIEDPSCWNSSNETGSVYQGVTPNVAFGFWSNGAGIFTNESQIGEYFGERKPAATPDPAPSSCSISCNEAAVEVEACIATCSQESCDGECGPVVTMWCEVDCYPSVCHGPCLSEAQHVPADCGSCARTLIEALTDPKDGIALAVTAAAGLALAVALHALYSRLGRSEVVDHPARRAILEEIQRRKVVSNHELRKALSLSESTLRYHVRFLEQSGYLRIQRSHDVVRFVPAGTDGNGSPFLDHPTRGPLIRLVRDHPSGLTRAEIHKLAADLPLRTRNHTLRRLLDLGVLQEIRQDGETRLVLTSDPAGRTQA